MVSERDELIERLKQELHSVSRGRGGGSVGSDDDNYRHEEDYDDDSSDDDGGDKDEFSVDGDRLNRSRTANSVNSDGKNSGVRNRRFSSNSITSNGSTPSGNNSKTTPGARASKHGNNSDSSGEDEVPLTRGRSLSGAKYMGSSNNNNSNPPPVVSNKPNSTASGGPTGRALMAQVRF